LPELLDVIVSFGVHRAFAALMIAEISERTSLPTVADRCAEDSVFTKKIGNDVTAASAEAIVRGGAKGFPFQNRYGLHNRNFDYAGDRARLQTTRTLEL
jgi:hypothetical protein